MNTQPLPIDPYLPAILDALARRPRLVLTASPGAGKTTRLPPALLDQVDGEVWVLEPRRVAARAAASRVAQERGGAVGDEVGWHVRFDRRAGRGTRLLYMTVGVYLRRLQDDPFLSGVGAVVVDELHERSLDLDLAIGLTRAVQREVRDDLLLVAMSATLDAGAVSAWLDAPVVAVPGALHEVRVRWDRHPDLRPLEDRAAEAIVEVCAETDGRVLVFLPGLAELHRVARRLPPSLSVDLLHGSFPLDEQARVIDGRSGGVVVLATNVAETSVTVSGVRAVVDAGVARQLRQDRGSGLDRLDLSPISQASAAQRAGRAGRLGPGLCRRLWTEAAHRQRPEHDLPEVARADLAGVVLQLLAWGEPDPAAFGWLQTPDPDALARATALLEALGLTRAGTLTELGRVAATLPVQPRLARLLLAVHAAGRLEEGAAAVAALGRRQGGGAELFAGVLRPSGPDEAREVEQLVRLTRAALGREQSRQGPDSLPRAALAAWPDRVALVREGGAGRMVGGRGVRLPADSPAGLYCCLDLEGSGQAATVRAFSAVRPEWLTLEDTLTVRLEGEVVRAVRQRRYRDLVLSEVAAPLPTDGSVEELLVRQALQKPIDSLGLDRDEVLQWLGRVALLRVARPGLELPDLLGQGLMHHLPDLVQGCRSLDEVRRQLPERLDRVLSWSQRQALRELTPEHLTVPSGSSRPLVYRPDGPPVLSVRMQELFGLRDTPRVAGRPVLLHLLAPNGRPQQVTDDLAGFWARTWPEVRRELRGRYPKHAWPEDPLSAAPLRGVKRRP
ncbi:MAG: ATP-dependent helicase HrpB [Deltaproteobacteria bacterium]|nr:ATP-dependent helicase HrpB [Deltaproteobacteria bacterium]